MRRDHLTLCAVLDAAGVALLVFFLAICKLSPALGVLAIVAAVGLWAASTSLANHHNNKYNEGL